MRLTSEMWVSALVRQVHGDGGFAAVVRRGNAQAGVVFITIRDRLGGVRLLAPAPQSLAETDERRFIERAVADESEVDQLLASEQRFDSDLWVVEFDGLARPLENYLDIVADENP